jgi:hypothetical protein
MNYNNVTLHRRTIMSSKLFLAILLALLVCTDTYARQSVTVDFGVYTTHIYSDIEYNEDNDLIGIEYKIGNWYINAATFNNSFYNRSNAIGSGYNIYSTHNVDFDVIYGLVTGYKDEDGVDDYTFCNDDVCVYAAPRVSYTFDVSKHFSIKPSAKLFFNAVVLSVGAEYQF